jgi:hypothetical protein
MFAQRFSLIAFAVGALLGIAIGFGVSKLGNVSKHAASNDVALQKIEQLQKAYDLMLAERRVSKLESKRSSIESPKKEIIVFTKPQCPPCKQWVETQPQVFRDAGWHVAICNEKNHSYEKAPTFQISIGNKSTIRVGSLSLDDAERIACSMTMQTP